MIARYSDRTVVELVDTLRYLKSQYEMSGRLDEANVEHIYKALALVDLERPRQHQREFSARYAASLPKIAAE